MERVFEVHIQCPSERNFAISHGAKSWSYVGDLTVSAGYGPLLREYVYFLLAKLAFHRQHPEFNGKSIRKPFHADGADKGQASSNTKSTSV